MHGASAFGSASARTSAWRERQFVGQFTVCVDAHRICRSATKNRPVRAGAPRCRRRRHDRAACVDAYASIRSRSATARAGSSRRRNPHHAATSRCSKSGSKIAGSSRTTPRRRRRSGTIARRAASASSRGSCVLASSIASSTAIGVARPRALPQQQAEGAMDRGERQALAADLFDQRRYRESKMFEERATPDGRRVRRHERERSRQDAIRGPRSDRRQARLRRPRARARRTRSMRRGVRRPARARCARRKRASTLSSATASKRSKCEAPGARQPIAHAYAVRPRISREIVAQTHARQNDADIRGQRATHFADSIQQSVGVRTAPAAARDRRRSRWPRHRRRPGSARARDAASHCASLARAHRAFRRRFGTRRRCAPCAAANALTPKAIKSGRGSAGTSASDEQQRAGARNASGRAKSCAARSAPSAPSEATRVTIMPIAVEIRNAGSVVTSALPIESSANVLRASSGDIP